MRRAGTGAAAGRAGRFAAGRRARLAGRGGWGQRAPEGFVLGGGDDRRGASKAYRAHVSIGQVIVDLKQWKPVGPPVIPPNNHSASGKIAPSARSPQVGRWIRAERASRHHPWPRCVKDTTWGCPDVDSLLPIVGWHLREDRGEVHAVTPAEDRLEGPTRQITGADRCGGALSPGDVQAVLISQPQGPPGTSSHGCCCRPLINATGSTCSVCRS